MSSTSSDIIEDKIQNFKNEINNEIKILEKLKLTQTQQYELLKIGKLLSEVDEFIQLFDEKYLLNFKYNNK